jgi:glycosyltransferase involved in cell wall biosynthesis
VWTHQGKAQVFYIPKVQWGIWSISRILRETPHDILYLNSFFSPWMTGLPLLLRYLKQFDTVPIILAPRGEFSPGALQLKAGKKKLYMAVLFSLGLCRNLIWQASSDKEGVDIHNVFHKAEKGSDIKIAPDLPDMLYAKKYIPNDNQISPTEINSLKILFISRISPKKNLDFLLRVLRNVSSPVDLSIYGPIDDSNYWSTCQALINDLPRQIKFEFGGEIEHEKVAGIFRNRVYQKLKGFKEDYPLSSDADFYLRALLSNLKFSRFSGESISCFRIHENQLTNKIKRSYGS